MTFFVYIETSRMTVPHMEPLGADRPSSATIEALALLQTHPSGTAAHVYDGDMRVAWVTSDEANQ